MAISEQAAQVAIIEAHFAAHGFVKGFDWTDVRVEEGQVRVFYPAVYSRTRSYEDWRDEVLYGAFVAAGLCEGNPLEFDEWKRGDP